ncbi:MAG TPA: hypothetical protein VMW41_00780 [Candidatus Bathyarchaeia archaeon]|nr:hypothetical protein [Candidatus Bathyarchaeia archaeon]
MSISTGEVKKEISFLKELVLLVGFKEAYFFLKNILGMIIHPEITTAKILSRKDLSQAFLVFGLPFNLWFLLLSFSLIIWLLVRPMGLASTLGIRLFLLSGFLLFVLTIYYFYWVIKYLRRVNKFPKG